ncbi:PEPxxWA-CTERM sorting domain-containing protein [Phenylobacterium sp.]|uniref:PEPxxWA-CTERM sorting domain-containing protein n=1 Tax=Phenylobacterium sp. TaxID=1871053 RepID=UPI0025E8A54B|nr:PEPxxWA-CTERM sorting domain-containing protein [Phenylobacterium sp.]
MVRGHQAAVATLAAALALVAPAARAASLLGQTFDGRIQITGDDDDGAYALDVFSGPVAVGGGFSQSFDVFKQHIRGGIGGVSNQLAGVVTLTVGPDTISVGFRGQSQGVRLLSSFSGIAGPIEGATHSATGVVDGLIADEGSTFTAGGVRLSLLFLGYEPHVDAAQTETLRLAASPSAGVPEPGTWTLLVAGFGLAGAALRRRPVTS